MSKRKFYVYVIRDPRPGKNNAPIYVGKGKGKRAYRHLFPSVNAGSTLNRIVLKCLAMGLKPPVRIAAYFEKERDAHMHEVKLIAKYGRRDKGAGTLCNLTDGGEGASGWVPNESFRKTLSIRLKRMHKNNPEWSKSITQGWHKWWSDPKIQQAFAARMRKEMQRPERLAQISANAKRNLADPRFIAKRSATLKLINGDPKFCARRIAKLQKRNAEPAFQKHVQQKRRIWIDKPETRTEMRAHYAKNKSAILQGIAKYWVNPANKRKQAERMRQRNFERYQ
jgi:hypothetical protein